MTMTPLARLVQVHKAGCPIPHKRDGVLDPVWPALEGDVEARADAVLVKELRRVPLDELCSVDLDLRRLQRPKLASAMAKAARIRATDGVQR